jgi:Mrp family chromosome partitioning ATPase
MRKPRIHDYLKQKVAPGTGFHELLLKGGQDYQRYVVQVRNLHVIPGSAPTSNPIASLASPVARKLIDQFSQDFRYVVIDAPPTLPIADSHILSGLCDKVLFVVRSRKTPRELFQHAVESFEATNLLGAVLNDVDYARSRYAYAYYYYQEKAK